MTKKIPAAEPDCARTAETEGAAFPDMEAAVDLSCVALDNSVPRGRRAAFILKAVKNPRCFRVGDIGVKLEFSEGAPALGEMFTDFLIRKKSGL